MGIFRCEEVGRHLRNGNQRHEHDDSNQSDAQYNGDGNKKHHCIFNEARGYSSCLCKLGVERNRHYGMVMC